MFSLFFYLSTFENHNKVYIYLITEKHKYFNARINICLYTIEEYNTIVVNKIEQDYRFAFNDIEEDTIFVEKNIEQHFIFIANTLKHVIEDFLFKESKIKLKLDNKLPEEKKKRHICVS